MTHMRMNSMGLVVSIVILLTFFLSAAAHAQSKASSSSERKAIESLLAAWNSRDVERVVAAFGNAAVYEDVAAGEIHRGKDQIGKWVVSAFRDIDNFKLEVVRSSFYKGGGVVEWVWSGTDTGLFKTGKSFTVRGVSVIEVREGKVSIYKEYYDFSTVMRQLGLLSAAKE